MGNFLKNEAGATSVEYGMMVSLIAVVIVLAVNELGAALSGKFVKARQSIN